MLHAFFSCIISLKKVIRKKVNILVAFAVLGAMVHMPEDQDKNQDRDQDRVMPADGFALTS